MLLILVLFLATGVSRCAEPGRQLAPPDPRPGESVRMRGLLDTDADCRLLRVEGGKVYSLAGRFPNYRDGERVCVFGTIATLSQCLHSPSIDVDAIRAWGACP